MSSMVVTWAVDDALNGEQDRDVDVGDAHVFC